MVIVFIQVKFVVKNLSLFFPKPRTQQSEWDEEDVEDFWLWRTLRGMKWIVLCKCGPETWIRRPHSQPLHQLVAPGSRLVNPIRIHTGREENYYYYIRLCHSSWSSCSSFQPSCGFGVYFAQRKPKAQLLRWRRSTITSEKEAAPLVRWLRPVLLLWLLLFCFVATHIWWLRDMDCDKLLCRECP